MSIQVTCPGCLSRFSVDDRFAGKKGPCPKCKKEITIPDKSQEVVIHSPENAGPKDSKGKLILKPLKREETKLSKGVLIGAIVGGIGVLVIAVLLRSFENTSPILLTLGAIALAPPLVIAGYGFLHDDELQGFEGQELWIRTSICSAVFASTWGLYKFLSWYFENKTLEDTSTIQMGIFVVVMIALGAVTSLAAFELEIGQAVMHYCVYFVVTFVLCLIMGLPLGEPLRRTPKGKTNTQRNQKIPPPPLETQDPNAAPAAEGSGA